MCRIEGCERHQFSNDGLCLTHTKDIDAPVEKKRTRKKKVDAVEVETNDDTTELETRETE